MEESNEKISKLKNELIKASNELESAYSQIERI